MIYQLFSKYYLSNLNPDISYEFFISDINNLKKGGINMSSPSAPYYYKTDSDTSHWETSCSKTTINRIAQIGLKFILNQVVKNNVTNVKQNK